MKSLLQFIKQFISNQGLFVFLSGVVTKLSMMFINIIGARLIPEADFGLIILVSSVFVVFTPLIGLGSNQGLLRFGILQKTDEAKAELNRYVFLKGLINHVFITLAFCVVSVVYALKYDGILWVIGFFAVRLLGYYFFNHIQSYYRMHGNNKIYSQVNMSVYLSGLALAGILTYFFGILGYLISMAVMPWVSLIYMKKRPRLSLAKPSIDLKQFWRYSIHASLTYFFSDMLFAMDFLLIGLFLDETSVAFYKVAVMLPMSLSFLPLIFMHTDYPKIVANSTNGSYLRFYVVNYYKLFIPIAILILIVGYLMKDSIIPLVFGENYRESDGRVFFVMLAALVGNMLMRNLYGNMISAIGKAHWNTVTSIGALVIILGLGIWWIPIYGIMGAAAGMAVAFTFTGVTGMLLFHNYLRNLKT